MTEGRNEVTTGGQRTSGIVGTSPTQTLPAREAASEIPADQKVPRTNYLLKSGNGTVAIDDYDPKVHGKVVEETDEQYQARMRQASRRPPSTGVPPTTIQNLSTFDTRELVPPAAPTAPAHQPAQVIGQRVSLESEDQAKQRDEAIAKAHRDRTEQEQAKQQGILDANRKAAEQAAKAGQAGPAAISRAKAPTSGELATAATLQNQAAAAGQGGAQGGSGGQGGNEEAEAERRRQEADERQRQAAERAKREGAGGGSGAAGSAGHDDQ